MVEELWGWRLAIQYVDGAEPSLDEPRPMRHGQFGRTKTVAVPSLRVEVKLRGDLCLLQSLEVKECIFLVHRVVLRLKQERRRCIGAGINSMRELVQRRCIR